MTRRRAEERGGTEDRRLLGITAVMLAVIVLAGLAFYVLLLLTGPR